ncbi:MAG: thioredoxin fold domain-containing protein [Planctomycetaceae bacterium]|nr:thioredoxin fold domain-containing protein [Planctomycetaceae bacterium]
MGRIIGSQWMGALLLVLTVSCNTNAADPAQTKPTGVHWQTDYRQAQQARIDKQMPMLIYLTMDGCPHCHRMLKTSYENKLVAGQIATQYVPAIINGTHQEDLAKQFGVRIYPTTFIVGPDNRVVDKMEGFTTATELHRRLTIVSRYYAQLARMKSKPRR